jgi:two-component sensor histidine kinase
MIHDPIRLSPGVVELSEQLREEIAMRERAQHGLDLLTHELNHRVKNILAMVQAIAVQTLRGAEHDSTRRAFEQRLLALARAHELLTRENWEGAELDEVVAGMVDLAGAQPAGAFRVLGPAVRLGPETAVALALALNELASNAIKHGALSVPGGWISIIWTVRPADAGLALSLTWTEHDGPLTGPPARLGFGSRLISGSFAAQMGTATLAYPPEGLRCDIAVILPSGASGAGA